MGNRIKLESTPLELAQLHFELGFRADFHKGIKGLRDILSPTLNFRSLEAKGISDEVWHLLHCLSWKERHAKGVPVIMTLEEWRQCIRNIPKIENHHPARHEHSGRIEIFVEDWNSDADETVKFCNFRYKPEWVEKNARLMDKVSIDRDELWNSKPIGGVTEW